MPAQELLGVVTDGSFSQGLRVRLLDPAAVERLRVGSFVVVEGDEHRYFGMVTDLALATTDSALAADPPLHSPFLHRVLRGTHAYATAEIRLLTRTSGRQ